MKILRNVGLFAGIHVLALALLVILANPGCSSSRAQTSAASAPPAADAPAPVAAPVAAPAPTDTSAAASPGPIFYSPTRPGTPAASALETQPVTGVTPVTTYTVVSGDSVARVAKKNHVTTSELLKANHLRRGATLHAGQKLIIPGKAPEGAPAAASAEAPEAKAAPAAEEKARVPAEGTRHTVRPGETLGAIARKYGVKVGAIATANNISDPSKIRPGQELIIPGAKTPMPRASSHKAAAAAAPASEEAAAPAAAPEAVPAPAPAAAPEIPVIKIDDSPAPAQP